MNDSALKSLAGTLAKTGGPLLATVLFGPAGGAIAGAVLGPLADAFGVSATPEAIEQAIASDSKQAEAVIATVERENGSAIMSEVNAYLADIQDARATTVKLVERGSVIAWGAPIVSVIVMIGFGIFSYLAIYAPPGQREVLLFLLGNWSILAGAVVNFWVGSSASSKDKDASIRDLMRAGASVPQVPPKRTGK